MAETEEIITAAKRLGSMISSTPAVKNYIELTRQLELDVSARSLIEQFEQLVEVLQQKEAAMQPIDITEKQKFQSLQQSMSIHPLLNKLSAAQGHYIELMKKVQDAINKGVSSGPSVIEGEAEASPPSKIII